MTAPDRASQELVLTIANELHAVLAGQPAAAAHTALAMVIGCTIIAVTRSAAEREEALEIMTDQVRGFMRPAWVDYVRDNAELIMPAPEREQ